MVKKNGAACPCQPEDIIRPPVPPITPIVSVKSVNGKVGDITCVESLLSSQLTATVTVGGVTVGDSFTQGTSLEAIIRQILCPTKALQSIVVTTPPLKVNYTVGETFNKDGMVVTAYYSDGTSSAVNSYTFEPSGALALTDTKVTITYTEEGIVKTTEQAITVVPAAIDVYFGALTDLPTSVSALDSLTKTQQTVEAMFETGVTRHINADEQYLTIAFKSIVGNIISITEDGFEAISDFNVYTFGDYKFYCSSDKVYDPEGEMTLVIKWGE